MQQDTRELFRQLEAALGDGAAAGALAELRQVVQTQELAALTADRYRELYERSLQLVAVRGLEPVGDEILHGMMELVGARRGFVGLLEADEAWSFLVARRMDRADIDDPTAQVSHSIIRRALELGEPLIVPDALDGPFASHVSVTDLALRSVACLPVRRGAAVVGFVYLDNARQPGLFDDAAADALCAWLPVVGEALARALDERQRDDQPLPGVHTRHPAQREQLLYLARAARSNLPLMLLGEVGTGRALIARKLHDASPRAHQRFVRLDAPEVTPVAFERLLGLQAAVQPGGTLYVHEVHRLSGVCQDLLLQRLRHDEGREPLLRLVASISAEPSAAMGDRTLSDDLYFRLATVVGRLLPLRDRREDIPLLARVILDRISKGRLELDPPGLAALLAHEWPRNLSELAEVLESAAARTKGRWVTDAALGTVGRTRKRGPVSEEEFREAWTHARGDVGRCAELLRVHRKSVFRLRRRFLS